MQIVDFGVLTMNGENLSGSFSLAVEALVRSTGFEAYLQVKGDHEPSFVTSPDEVVISDDKIIPDALIRSWDEIPSLLDQPDVQAWALFTLKNGRSKPRISYLLLDLGSSLQFRRLLLEGDAEDADAWSPDGLFETTLDEFSRYIQVRKDRHYYCMRVNMSDIRAVLTASQRCE